MTAEEMKQIVEQVTAAVTTRPVAPTPPAVQMQPLSAMVVPPAGNMALPPAVTPIGVSLALELPSPDGSGTISAHVQLPPEALQNLPAVIANLMTSGWPLRVYRPRQNMAGGWGQGGNFGRRSWR